MKPRWRVADVLRRAWVAFNENTALPPHVAQALRRMLPCRTEALGGHLHQCEACGAKVPMYNGCQDRHCPSCHSRARKKWLDKRMGELLPVPYFHVVFTLPHVLNPLVNAQRVLLLNEFFQAVGWVLQRFAHDPQWRLEGQLGTIAILHTWNQRLHEHFHIHLLIPGGVWQEKAQHFKICHRKWLFGKKPLAEAFRNRFIKRLHTLQRKFRHKGSG